MRSKKVAYGEQEQLERDWILFHKCRAVLEHRKMWKWIAHAIAVDKENMNEDILEYKHEYPETMIALNLNLQGICGTEETNVMCTTSDYGIITNKAYYKQWRKCCKLAYKIAMLPERSIEDYV